MLTRKNIFLTIFIGYVGHSLYTLYNTFQTKYCGNKATNCIHQLGVNELYEIRYGFTILNYLRDTDTLYNIKQKLNVFKTIELNLTDVTDKPLYFHATLKSLDQSIQTSISQKLSIKQIPETTAISLLKNDSIVKHDGQEINHYPTKITIHLLYENKDVDLNGLTNDIYRLIRINRKKEFHPIIYLSDIDVLHKYFKPYTYFQNNSISLNVKPITFGKIHFFNAIEQSIVSMKQLGFTEKDADEIKSLFVDTNIYLLMVTFVISFMHLLFDTLAFKNDISFWRSRDTLVGISSKTVIWRCFSQFIIFLYLCNEKTSLLVLIPTGIGVIIEFWKVTKALKFRLVRNKSSKWFFTIVKTKELDCEKETQQHDSQALSYLSYLLYPLCIGGALYSLLYVPHKSWWSWLITSLVNGVYAFGFIFMMPQLFLNYKLKSVAHLPWKPFMYKAFNTFIDDLFAFIITMPTTHRLACFRDDLVFLCYLYQRWLYPVDKNRMDETATTFEETDYNITSKNKKID